MTKWTFQVKYPAPFKADWMTSEKRWIDSQAAGKAGGEYASICADNGTIVEIRLMQCKGDS